MFKVMSDVGDNDGDDADDEIQIDDGGFGSWTVGDHSSTPPVPVPAPPRSAIAGEATSHSGSPLRADAPAFPSGVTPPKWLGEILKDRSPTPSPHRSPTQGSPRLSPAMSPAMRSPAQSPPRSPPPEPSDPQPEDLLPASLDVVERVVPKKRKEKTQEQVAIEKAKKAYHKSLREAVQTRERETAAMIQAQNQLFGYVPKKLKSSIKGKSPKSIPPLLADSSVTVRKDLRKSAHRLSDEEIRQHMMPPRFRERHDILGQSETEHQPQPHQQQPPKAIYRVPNPSALAEAMARATKREKNRPSPGTSQGIEIKEPTPAPSPSPSTSPPLSFTPSPSTSSHALGELGGRHGGRKGGEGREGREGKGGSGSERRHSAPGAHSSDAPSPSPFSSSPSAHHSPYHSPAHSPGQAQPFAVFQNLRLTLANAFGYLPLDRLRDGLQVSTLHLPPQSPSSPPSPPPLPSLPSLPLHSLTHTHHVLFLPSLPPLLSLSLLFFSLLSFPFLSFPFLSFPNHVTVGGVWETVASGSEGCLLRSQTHDGECRDGGRCRIEPRTDHVPPHPRARNHFAHAGFRGGRKILGFEVGKFGQAPQSQEAFQREPARASGRRGAPRHLGRSLEGSAGMSLSPLPLFLFLFLFPLSFLSLESLSGTRVFDRITHPL